MSPEQRAELRRLLAAWMGGDHDSMSHTLWVKVLPLLPALLDAAEERDRLRADFRRLDEYTHTRILWLEQERDRALDALRAADAQGRLQSNERATLAAIRDRLDRCACEGACAVGADVREVLDKEER